MSHWNYRIGQERNTDTEYTIYEVYYDDNGNTEAMTEKAVSFHAESVKELAKIMLEALEKPVVVWDEKLRKPVELL